jgi:hypothetical protein
MGSPHDEWIAPWDHEPAGARLCPPDQSQRVRFPVAAAAGAAHPAAPRFMGSLFGCESMHRGTLRWGLHPSERMRPRQVSFHPQD